ncbi:MAG: DNA gyrase subunit A [Patescibacteria group bacterium]|nr:DNA gyrase subunit A [Patescibacteria group bacterium]
MADNKQDQGDPQEPNEESENPSLFDNEDIETPKDDKEPGAIVENKHLREISDEMEECYLDYAMSVIVSRALPDVRDGLKPVHRRILYSMHELGLRPTAAFRKSATVVGDVLGKYHPHGDSAVYDSMVRLAQDFAMRYRLVRGQGNFGSIDGDSAAAMRYTEAKMERLSEEMLADIDKETVKWAPNYDGRLKEPTVLPAKVPQLLLNGTMGIAVGMATNIPPHNLGELIDGLFHLSDNPECSIEELMEFIKGPDFPTSGIIYNQNAIKEMYSTGRGGIIMRAKADIVERKSGKFQIIVSEIPYQVNKSSLVTKIADLVRDKKIRGITDIRDESNREGIRVVVELKKDTYPRKILNQLFKLTQMQTSFNMNMIALVDGLQPRLLNLKQVLEYFIEHRKEVITNRTKYELKIAKARAHILEGLVIALDNIDAVIETIKKSPTKEDAHSALMKKFQLSELQSSAILEMRLQTLAGLERQKIEDEYKAKLTLMEELEGILSSKQKIINIMKEELAEIKEKYGDARKTKIIKSALGAISSKDTIPNEPIIITLTKENYIKRLPHASFKAQKRGGKGVIGMSTKEEDEIAIVKSVMNHDDIMFFTSNGRVFKLPAYEIPQSSRQAKGIPVVNLLQLGENERVTAILKDDGKETGKYLFMATHNGTVKKTAIEDFKNIRKTGLIAIKLREGDSLEWVRETNPGNRIVLVTREGKCIQFDEGDARSMGRASTGVRGIRLKDKDYCVQMDVVTSENDDLLTVMGNGLGKRTPLLSYRFQSRGGSGVKTANITEKTGKVIGAAVIKEGTESDLMLVSRKGQTIRMALTSIPRRGRATQGVYLMRFKSKGSVASISVIEKVETPEEIAEKEALKKQESKQTKLIKV